MVAIAMTHMVNHSMHMVQQSCSPRHPHRHMAGQLGVGMGGLVGLGLPIPMLVPLLLFLLDPR